MDLNLLIMWACKWDELRARLDADPDALTDMMLHLAAFKLTAKFGHEEAAARLRALADLVEKWRVMEEAKAMEEAHSATHH
jgi:hypothetical protein